MKIEVKGMNKTLSLSAFERRQLHACRALVEAIELHYGDDDAETAGPALAALIVKYGSEVEVTNGKK